MSERERQKRTIKYETIKSYKLKNEVIAKKILSNSRKYSRRE